MNRVPVAEDGNPQQQKRNQQQPRSLSSINRVALVPAIGIVLPLRIVRLDGHPNIVAPLA